MSRSIDRRKVDAILAIEGGKPIRSRPLPEESPGIHYFGDKELEYVTRVVKARSMESIMRSGSVVVHKPSIYLWQH